MLNNVVPVHFLYVIMHHLPAESLSQTAEHNTATAMSHAAGKQE